MQMPLAGQNPRCQSLHDRHAACCRQVFGVFMRNWDETEELGNQNCSVERDFQVTVFDSLRFWAHQLDVLYLAQRCLGH